jgi:hypothetical protein
MRLFFFFLLILLPFLEIWMVMNLPDQGNVRNILFFGARLIVLSLVIVIMKTLEGAKKWGAMGTVSILYIISVFILTFTMPFG